MGAAYRFLKLFDSDHNTMLWVTAQTVIKLKFRWNDHLNVKPCDNLIRLLSDRRDRVNTKLSMVIKLFTCHLHKYRYKLYSLSNKKIHRGCWVRDLLVERRMCFIMKSVLLTIAFSELNCRRRTYQVAAFAFYLKCIMMQVSRWQVTYHW